MGKAPVFGIAGYSGSGKTALIEKLLPELHARGYRTAVIKHDAHPSVFDQPGKDTYRFTQAGASVTAVTSGIQTMVIENRPLPPEELAGRIEGVDIILAEGFKSSSWPKLLVCHGEEGEDLPLPLPECAAIITDGPKDLGLPSFKHDDVKKIADFIISELKIQIKG